MKEFGVFCAKKRSKNLAGHELCEDLFKQNCLETTCLERSLFVEEIGPVDEGGEVFSRDNLKVVDLVLYIVCSATKMRGTMIKQMFQY